MLPAGSGAVLNAEVPSIPGARVDVGDGDSRRVVVTVRRVVSGDGHFMHNVGRTGHPSMAPHAGPVTVKFGWTALTDEDEGSGSGESAGDDNNDSDGGDTTHQEL